MLIPFKKFFCKTIPVYSFLPIFLLLLSFTLALLHSIAISTPDIAPTYLYSSGISSENYYEAHFNISSIEEDTFYIIRRDPHGSEHTIMNGYYHQINGNIYGLYDHAGVPLDLLILGKNSFYFLDPDYKSIIFMQGI